MTEIERFSQSGSSNAGVERRLVQWFVSELSRAETDVQGGLLGTTGGHWVTSGPATPRWRTISLIAAAIAFVVVAVLVGSYASSVGKATPSANASASPGVVLGENRLPVSINGATVLGPAEGLNHALTSLDASTFLVSGWLDDLKAACPSTPATPRPRLLDTGLCGSQPALVGGPPFSATGQPANLDPSNQLWAVFLADSSPVEPKTLASGPSNLAVVLRVHTHDPSAETCSSEVRAACELAVVVDAVLWQSESLPTKSERPSPSPNQPIVLGANGLPTSINGEPVLIASDGLARALGSNDASTFLVGGWLDDEGMLCPISLGPPKPVLLDTGFCGSAPALLGAAPSGPNGPANITLADSLYLWPVFLEGSSPPEPQPPLGPGAFNVGVVLRVHTHDPTAASCAASLRSQCEHAVVVDRVEWLFESGPFPSSVSSGPSPTHRTDPSFHATSSMSTARENQTATALPDGRVLIAGGEYIVSSGFHQLEAISIASAEVFDPITGRFSPTGSMSAPRVDQTATLLRDGRVLIAGGWDGTEALASAELYDPTTGRFTATGSMGSARSLHTAALLADGRVLIVGGFDSPSSWLASAELYDPATGTFSPTGAMSTTRSQDTATLLASGLVLIAGGQLPNSSTGSSILSSAELYDPSSGTFKQTGSMIVARAAHAATLLTDGQVLITGGATTADGSKFVASAELYDPQTGAFTPTGSMAVKRYGQTGTVLGDGRVLIAAGDDTSLPVGSHGTAEIYDPTSGTFGPTITMIRFRNYGTATLLPDGSVLIVGGNGAGNTAELFKP